MILISSIHKVVYKVTALSELCFAKVLEKINAVFLKRGKTMKKISVLIMGLCLCVGAHAATIEVLPITIPVVVGGAMPGQYVKNGSEYTFHIPVDDIRKDVPQVTPVSPEQIKEYAAAHLWSSAGKTSPLVDNDGLKRFMRNLIYSGKPIYYFYSSDVKGYVRILLSPSTHSWEMQQILLGSSITGDDTVGFYWNGAESRLMRMKSQGDIFVEYSETTACLLPDDETGDLYELTAAEKAELPTVPA